VQDVKIQRIGAVWGLIKKLQQYFLSQEIMNAIGIINP
jgi:hypothetical protein